MEQKSNLSKIIPNIDKPDITGMSTTAIIIIIIVVVVLLLGLGTGGYFLYKSNIEKLIVKVVMTLHGQLVTQKLQLRLKSLMYL